MISAKVLQMTRYNPLKIGKDEVRSNQWRNRLHYLADLIRADSQTVYLVIVRTLSLARSVQLE